MADSAEKCRKGEPTVAPTPAESAGHVTRGDLERATMSDAPAAATAAKATKPSGSHIVVSTRQKGNPVLEHVKHTWEYGDILADYQVGATTGVLYLRHVPTHVAANCHSHIFSLKYHHLHPQYILNRFEKLGRSYDLRILLILCDVTEHQNSIKELTKACLLNQITVMVAWSTEEAGYYLGTYKKFEFRSHQLIKERVDADYASVLRAALTSIRGVNKTDVMTLRTNFGSFKNMTHATTEDLQLCPGFGPTKVRRLREAFNKPFYSSGQKPLGIPGRDVQSALVDANSGNLEPGGSSLGGNVTFTPVTSAARHSSPEWNLGSPVETRLDLDLDLDLELNPSDEESAPTTAPRTDHRNVTDLDPEVDARTVKKRRPN